jgi:3-oxoacyl-[acyl-carrier-protein] synthase II
MRADVPTFVTESQAHQAHELPSVGFTLDVPVVALEDAPRVAITSWHAQTAFGDVTETWDALLRGQCVDDNARLTCAGERNRARGLARVVSSRLHIDPNAALIVGTSKGSIDEWFPGAPRAASTSDEPTTGLSTSALGDIAVALAADRRTRGPVLTLSAACASGLHALVRAAMMIRAREVRQALVVATEASVHPLFIGSFRRLGVLAKPGAGCRPFDRGRTGFYMSEAACAVLLEARDGDNAADPAVPTVCVERFALGGDATHLTGGDPDGRVLRHLLRKVIGHRPVDLVHAHGTGTVLNDETELAAIEASVLEDEPDGRPIVYSHKAALGHSLGASGLLSVVLNCMAHSSGIIPGNVRTTDPLPAGRVSIPHSVTRRPVRRSLAVAAGFGGTTAVVSLVSNV